MKKAIITLAIGLLCGSVAFGQGTPVIPYMSIYIRTLLDDVDAATARTTLGLSDEVIQDLVGAMVGTQTFISVIYQDGTDDIDFIVPVKDEDDMASNSSVHLATQQSIKAYSDSKPGVGPGNIVWREIRYDYALMKKKTDAPPAEESEGVGVSGNILAFNYAFDPANGDDEAVFWTSYIPKDIDDTQNIQFYVGWFPDSGWGSGQYRWVLEYLVRDADDMYGADVDRTAGTPTVIYEDVTPENATDMILTPFYDPNTIDADKNQVIFFHMYLDASESDADDDAHVLYTVLEYASNIQNTQGARMLFEDSDKMLFENGAEMIFE